MARPALKNQAVSAIQSSTSVDVAGSIGSVSKAECPRRSYRPGVARNLGLNKLVRLKDYFCQNFSHLRPVLSSERSSLSSSVASRAYVTQKCRPPIKPCAPALGAREFCELPAREPRQSAREGLHAVAPEPRGGARRGGRAPFDAAAGPGRGGIGVRPAARERGHRLDGPQELAPGRVPAVAPAVAPASLPRRVAAARPGHPVRPGLARHAARRRSPRFGRVVAGAVDANARPAVDAVARLRLGPWLQPHRVARGVERGGHRRGARRPGRAEDAAALRRLRRFRGFRRRRLDEPVLLRAHGGPTPVSRDDGALTAWG